MWPRGRSGRGPGSSPVKRAAARASTICALPVPSVARTCSNERTSVSSGPAAVNCARRDLGRAFRSPPGGPPPASAAGRRRGPRPARARTRGTSTRLAPRCRGPRCHRRRRASRRRRPAPRRSPRKAPATAACVAATSRDRRCRRCRRRPRPECGPPGTRQPGRAPALGRCQEPSSTRTALSCPPSAASQSGVTTSGVSSPLMPVLRRRA